MVKGEPQIKALGTEYDRQIADGFLHRRGLGVPETDRSSDCRRRASRCLILVNFHHIAGMSIIKRPERARHAPIRAAGFESCR